MNSAASSLPPQDPSQALPGPHPNVPSPSGTGDEARGRPKPPPHPHGPDADGHPGRMSAWGQEHLGAVVGREGPWSVAAEEARPRAQLSPLDLLCQTLGLGLGTPAAVPEKT